MNYQTAEQLTAMKLNAMRLEYARQDELPASQALSFDDRLGMIVTAQFNARAKAKTNRLIRLAHLREPTACLANIDYDPVRKIKKSDIARLSDCQWIKGGSNLIITGATGVGKTYLLSAFGREACTKGFTVKCYRTTRLLTDLTIGKGDGSYNKLMKDLVRPDLLILDDLGTEFKNQYSVASLYNIINTRILHGAPTVISTNFTLDDLERDYNQRITSRLLGEYSALVLEGSDIRYLK